MALKAIKLNLQTAVVSSYDQTKTTVVGNVSQQVVSATNTLSPGRVRWFDVFTDAAITPNGQIDYTVNNRIFTMSSEAGGLVNMALHTYDPVTKVKSYLGKVIFTIIDSPATTHTFRAVQAVDTGTTGWKIFFVTTGSVTANGGLYMINNLALADFSIGSPPTIPLATAGGQKAVYKLENSPFTLTAGKGIILDIANTRVYVHNGVSATHQYYKFNYSNAITTVTGGITTNLFEFVTGNLPALAGTLLQTNSENFCVPSSGVNSGFDCGFFATTTVFYRFKLSDLTNGGTTIPSLESIDTAGSTNQFTITQPTNAFFSTTLQRVIYTSNQQGFLFVKTWANSTMETTFGVTNLSFLETQSDPFVNFGFQTIDGTAVRNGTMFICGNTTGQRGLMVYDLRSANLYDYSYFISPVITVDTLILKELIFEKIASRITSTIAVSYRTTGFGSPTGSWIDIINSALVTNLDAISPTVSIQFKIRYRTADMAQANPSEIIEGYIIADTTISENLDSVLTQLQTDHTNFQTDHTNFQSDHTNFIADDAAFDADHVNFQNDHTNFIADDAAFDTDHANFQADHVNFVADDAAFDTDHANFQADHLAFVADDAAFDADHVNFQSDHTDLQSDHNNFQSDHNDLQSDHAAFVADDAAFDADHANFQADHLAFVADDAAFDTDHANFQADHSDLQSDHSDLQSDHTNFQNDHSDLQLDHSNFQDDHNDLQSDHSDLQSDHSNFQSDLSDLEAAIDDIEASSGTLVSAIDAIAGGPTLEVEDSEAAELEVDTDDDLDLEVEE